MPLTCICRRAESLGFHQSIIDDDVVYLSPRSSGAYSDYAAIVHAEQLLGKSLEH